ncbi:ER protein Pkr1-domain-containing protein [Cubamyces lactineus]|nr:ER protein Pkr1-domain-containing protein [Cubamyces lactineus]
MASDAGSPSALADLPNATPESTSDGGFFSNILTPGSSLNPTFLRILDGAFALLFAVLFSLFILTRGNIHLLFLMVIECCLWASVKWFVHELQQVRLQEGTSQPNGEQTEDKTNTRPKAE